MLNACKGSLLSTLERGTLRRVRVRMTACMLCLMRVRVRGSKGVRVRGSKACPCKNDCTYAVSTAPFMR